MLLEFSNFKPTSSTVSIKYSHDFHTFSMYRTWVGAESWNLGRLPAEHEEESSL
jgi:hypothetical protein